MGAVGMAGVVGAARVVCVDACSEAMMLVAFFWSNAARVAAIWK